MRSNFKYILLIFICSLLTLKNVNAEEPFVFDVTEIEILENGDQINGYKGGTAVVEDGSKIRAENFLYNKLTNILEAIGNVKYFNETKNIIITSDKVIYFKNKEKVYTIGNSKAVNENNTITASNLEYDKINNIFIAKKNVVINDFKKDTIIYTDEATYLKNKEETFTKGKTRALIQKKYKFNSSNVTYLRNTEDLFSKEISTVEDDNGNIYKLDNFLYNIDKELLKGEKVKVLARVDKNKTDKYFFSEGFFNFKDKSHVAKETKINTHKEVFDDKNQDPRLYGSSSYSNEYKTVVNNGLFTSCKINDNCPPWSIKAEKITHDKIKRDMIYKNAILKIYDIPVLYFPKFFHPDPAVKRRSGFLQPQFNNSETLGSSVYIPYFKTLGHNKDITFKPTLFEKLKKFEREKYILQSEYRKQGKDSFLIADFGMLRDYKRSSDNKYKNANHLFLDYNADLKIPNYTNSELSVHLEKVTNDTYLKVFQNNLFDTHTLLKPDNLGSMRSNIELYLDQEDQNFTTGITVSESLSGKNNDRYQYTLPYYNLSKNLTSILPENYYFGSLNFSSNGSNNLKNTNNLVSQISNSFDYSSPDFISNLGFKNNFSLYLNNINTIGKNDATYTSSTKISGSSLLMLDTAIPLAKYNENSTETITPRISFRINPANNMNDYSTTSKSVDYGNIFDVNRLGISDYEAGRSLTLGLGYKLDSMELDENQNKDKEIKDKYIEFNLATVLRDQIEKEIPSSSTINRKSSNLFGSIDNRIFENINLSYNFSLDNDMKTINSNSINTEISLNNFITTFDFHESRNELGSTHYISNTSEYKVNDNTSLRFSTRRNKEINLTEYYDLSYEYKNDCLIAALKFNKTFYQDNDLVPTEDLFFTITLIPLTTYEREIYKKIPGSPGLKSWFR
jgi:LPS-assembly protein